MRIIRILIKRSILIVSFHPCLWPFAFWFLVLDRDIGMWLLSDE